MNNVEDVNSVENSRKEGFGAGFTRETGVRCKEKRNT